MFALWSQIPTGDKIDFSRLKISEVYIGVT